MRSLFLLASLAPFAAAEDAKITPNVYGPYFESNKSGLKGDSSFLVISDAKKFNEVLRPLPPVGKRRTVMVPKDAFEKSLVLVVIKRGKEAFGYTVEKAEAKGDTLRLYYKSAGMGVGGGTATFASPLVVTVPKGKYKSVEFIENGKPSGSAKLLPDT
jgi:hypothetical protein